MESICVRGMIRRERGVWRIVRRKNGVEYYVIPGGGVENDENLEEALKRELREELNIEVNIKDLAFKTETDDRIEYFYECEYVSGDFTLNGEELDRISENNYYEPTFLKLEEVNNVSLQKEVQEYLSK